MVLIHLGISDHSLVYLVRKFTPPKSRKAARKIRNFKNFVESDSIQDISTVPWDMIYQSDNPNICWQIWKSLFLEVLDRHAPLRRKRLRQVVFALQPKCITIVYFKMAGILIENEVGFVLEFW